MKSIEQLEEWLKGNPIHNKSKDECCPDFSCCKPDSLSPLNERQEFYNAFTSDNEEKIRGMLMMFLSKALQDENAYVAGFNHD